MTYQPGAVAAGCPAVVKPSELLPETNALLGELFTKYLDQVSNIDSEVFENGS